MNPIIVICGGVAYDTQFCNSAFMCNKTYTSAIAIAGGVPLLAMDAELADEYASFADGLVITGSAGFVPNPALYKKLENDFPKREKFDEKIYKAFVKAKKPIIGICQGLQEIDEFQGGNLQYDFRLEDEVEHMMTQHMITTEKESLLYKLFGERIEVNSRHNYKIKTLGKDLKVTAYSDDGVIEAIEHVSLPIFGFEYHPERMCGGGILPPEGDDMRPIFNEFIRLCRETKERLNN